MATICRPLYRNCSRYNTAAEVKRAIEMTERKNGTDPSVPGNTIADGTSPRDGVSRVLVTGATGFLGRAVVEAFELARWQVFGTGFSRATAHNPRVVKLDLLDSAAVETLIKSTKFVSDRPLHQASADKRKAGLHCALRSRKIA